MSVFSFPMYAQATSKVDLISYDEYVSVENGVTYKITQEDFSNNQVVLKSYINNALKSEYSTFPGTGIVDVKKYEKGNVKNDKIDTSLFCKVTTSSTEPIMNRAENWNYLGGLRTEYGYETTQVNFKSWYTETYYGGQAYEVDKELHDLLDIVSLFISLGFALSTQSVKILLADLGYTIVGFVVDPPYKGKVNANKWVYNLKCTDLANGDYTRYFNGEKYYVTEVDSKQYNKVFYEGLVPAYWKTTKYADELMFRFYDVSLYTLLYWY